ncbi:MAG: putative DNA binding domain-containing protein [Anaerolineae bacterium]|nr:putative DNA binding domain-containing protein [Anaerolineae bacterium]
MASQFPLGNKRPGSQLAFLPETDADLLAECLVAFANGEGGLIVLGLDEDGRYVNEIWGEEAEGAFRAAASNCRPPVRGDWQQVETAQGMLIGIRVTRSNELHSLADGRVLIRSGANNRPLSGQEVHQLASTKDANDYETQPVPGATQQDFDPEIVAEYVTKREQRGTPRPTNPQNMLFEIGAVDQYGDPTVTGILLLGKRPQTFLPQSGLVFVKFPGTEPRGEDGGVGYGRRDELNGPLARIIERAWAITWEEMRVGATVNGLEREELPEYPPFAVREALVNAVCHRDYSIKGRRTEIRMYADRLEIISPGGLPGYITIDNLVEEHYSRNPRLVNGLYQWGYIEELGLGIDRMIEEMVQAGHNPPQFRETPYSFTVTLTNSRERRTAPRGAQSMNERQARALAYTRQNGSITNREYQRLFEDVSSETLRRDLVDLVERGHLLKIGSNKGTYYILK